MKSGYYAGIGSRAADAGALLFAERIAGALADLDWTLRSGHAPGADQAFERGAGQKAEVFLPWPTFEVDPPCRAGLLVHAPSEAAYVLAARYHPAWDRLGRGARALHARNVHQVLGRDLSDPVRFVLCWTPNAAGGGGTGQAIRIARARDIPVFDIADLTVRAKVEVAVSVAKVVRDIATEALRS